MSENRTEPIRNFVPCAASVIVSNVFIIRWDMEADIVIQDAFNAFNAGNPDQIVDINRTEEISPVWT